MTVLPHNLVTGGNFFLCRGKTQQSQPVILNSVCVHNAHSAVRFSLVALKPLNPTNYAGPDFMFFSSTKYQYSLFLRNENLSTAWPYQKLIVTSDFTGTGTLTADVWHSSSHNECWSGTEAMLLNESEMIISSSLPSSFVVFCVIACLQVKFYCNTPLERPFSESSVSWISHRKLEHIADVFSVCQQIKKKTPGVIISALLYVPVLLPSQCQNTGTS